MLCIPLSLFFFSKLLSISTYTHHILDSDFVHITPEISDILSKLTYLSPIRLAPRFPTRLFSSLTFSFFTFFFEFTKPLMTPPRTFCIFVYQNLLKSCSSSSFFPTLYSSEYRFLISNYILLLPPPSPSSSPYPPPLHIPTSLHIHISSLSPSVAAIALVDDDDDEDNDDSYRYYHDTAAATTAACCCIASLTSFFPSFFSSFFGVSLFVCLFFTL